MSPRDWPFRIDDIAEALESIGEYVQGMSYQDWIKDKKTIDAVIRNFEIIGEAAAYIPENIMEEYSAIPLSKMKAMRNLLIHEYFGVDLDILWKTIEEDLPYLVDSIAKLSRDL